jgi:hypothetical protein
MLKPIHSEGVGVMNDEDLQFEEIDVSHVSAMASLRG